jgi:pyridoxine 5-phosphate synthase
LTPRLSVNVNKVATLRNSRRSRVPDVVHAALACVNAGAGGITVHPRADGRHITIDDVRLLKAALAGRWSEGLEFNIEGDPRPEWMALVSEIRPTQATLVPVRPGEVTSQAGWNPDADSEIVTRATAQLRPLGIRVSVFVDPTEEAVRFAKACGADRVELYTEPFALAFQQGKASCQKSLERYAHAARLAHDVGLGVNAGHDLDRDNLSVFRNLPHLDEVSIGHAIWAEALFHGIEHVVSYYLALLVGTNVEAKDR